LISYKIIGSHGKFYLKAYLNYGKNNMTTRTWQQTTQDSQIIATHIERNKKIVLKTTKFAVFVQKRICFENKG